MRIIKVVGGSGGGYDDSFLRSQAYKNARLIYDVPIIPNGYWPPLGVRAWVVGSGANIYYGRDSLDQPAMKFVTSATTYRYTHIGVGTINPWSGTEQWGVFQTSRNPEMIVSVQFEAHITQTICSFGFAAAEGGLGVWAACQVNWGDLLGIRHLDPTLGDTTIYSTVPVDSNWINLKLKVCPTHSELYRSPDPTNFEDWTLIAENSFNVPLTTRKLYGQIRVSNQARAFDLRVNIARLMYSQDYV